MWEKGLDLTGSRLCAVKGCEKRWNFNVYPASIGAVYKGMYEFTRNELTNLAQLFINYYFIN